MQNNLSCLKIRGTKAKILGFCGSAWVIERLKEMGFHQGLTVTYLGQAPFWGPQIYRVGVTVVALRQEEAQCAVIEK